LSRNLPIWAVLALLLVHAAIVGLLCLWDVTSAEDLVFSVLIWGVVCALGAVFQAAGTWFARRRGSRKLGVFVLLAPGPAVIAAFVVLGWAFPPVDPANQRHTAPSPDGRFVLEVRVESPAFDERYWVVHISEGGREVYHDPDLDIAGRFNAYWGWDDDDRVWLYHSDASDIYYWEQDPGGGWTRHAWDRQAPGALHPPDYVLPAYAHADVAPLRALPALPR
jgi:hypothetical protein